jgi:hypothetical protein
MELLRRGGWVVFFGLVPVWSGGEVISVSHTVDRGYELSVSEWRGIGNWHVCFQLLLFELPGLLAESFGNSAS